MAGPVAHLTYGFVLAVFYMHISRSAFTPTHALLYALNCFIGPDYGHLIEMFMHPLYEPIGTAFKSIAHSFFGFVFVFAPCLSFILMHFTRIKYYNSISSALIDDDGKRLFRLGDGAVYVHQMPSLRYSQVLMVVIAGGLSHFAIDYVFEDNGNAPTFRFIINTGYWSSSRSVFEYPSVVVTTGVACILIVCGFYWSFMRKNTYNSKDMMRYIGVISTTVILYCMFLAYRRWWVVDDDGT